MIIIIIISLPSDLLHHTPPWIVVIICVPHRLKFEGKRLLKKKRKIRKRYISRDYYIEHPTWILIDRVAARRVLWQWFMQVIGDFLLLHRVQNGREQMSVWVRCRSPSFLHSFWSHQIKARLFLRPAFRHDTLSDLQPRSTSCAWGKIHVFWGRSRGHVRIITAHRDIIWPLSLSSNSSRC